jgi:predicted DNA-binding transcriptional regulator YafY
MSGSSDIPYAQRQRLQFIETMVLWEGAVQRHRVSDVFQVNPNHITRDIQRYLERFPHNLEYDLTRKAYLPGPRFKPELTSGDPVEYLVLLEAYARSQSDAVLPALGTGKISAEAVPRPGPTSDRTTLMHVLQALRGQTGLHIAYHSLHEDEPVERRIWPHALVSNGDRWHLRAFDDRRDTFRDFVLQRMESVVPIADHSPIPSTQDLEWEAIETLQVIPNPRLNEHHKRLVAREYGMRKDKTGWVWQVRIRRALVGYFAQRYRLDALPREKPAPRIVLFDRRKLEKLFFQDASHPV